MAERQVLPFLINAKPVLESNLTISSRGILMYLLIAAAIFLMAKIHGTSLKIYIYDLPQWKNVSNFGKSSKGPDIR